MEDMLSQELDRFRTDVEGKAGAEADAIKAATIARINQRFEAALGEGVVDPDTIPLEEHGPTTDEPWDHINGQLYVKEVARQRWYEGGSDESDDRTQAGSSARSR